MRHIERFAFTSCVLAGLTGCNLARPYVRPASPLPSHLPYVADSANTGSQPTVNDPKLIALIYRALEGNRDLRSAVESSITAQAQFRAQRSAEFPLVSVEAGGTALPIGGDNTIASRSAFATVGTNSFEIDLFSRLKNLSRAAFADYLASSEGVAETRLTLGSAVARGYIDLAADKDLLVVARQTAEAGDQTMQITKARNASGLASGTDVQNATIILQQARADEQEQVTRLDQDRDALQFLVGGPIMAGEEPSSLDDLDRAIATVDPSSSATVLLRRPDVRQAELQLRAAGYRIGAARAAFFPTVTLSSAFGFAGTALSNLLTGGAASLIITPTVSAPVIGGPIKANLAQARAQQASAVANYERALQAGFRDVADGLARKKTIGAERVAQAGLVAAAAEAYRLSLLRFKAGEGTFLAALVDQQTLYGARKQQIALAGVDLRNRITLSASLALL